MSPDRADLDAGPLHELVSSYASEHHCPTIVWGVVIDGALTATGSVGSVTERTVYRIASMTKSFSAAATMLLRDEGVLRLDDRIADHAPELAALSHADSAPITIRDLLSMTSGLPTDDPWADRHLDLSDDEFDRIIADGLLFAQATGNTFEYSNFGFALLGRVVRRASGRRIQDVITERFLAPLAMDATTWVQPQHDDWARPQRWLDDRFVDELEPLADGLIAPMGGLWTTLADLATWVSWLDDAYPARTDADRGPLSRASRREMQTVQRYIGIRTVRGTPAPAGYGYGLVLLDEPGLGTVVTHSGGLPGYGSNMRWVPGRRTGVIALANSTYAPMLELTARLLDLIAGQGLVPTPATAVPDHVLVVAHRLIALLGDWDDVDAVALFTTSLVLDDPLDRRRRSAETLRTEVGALTIRTVEAPTNARGVVRCESDSGRLVTVTFLLAPPSPPRIQAFTATVDDTVPPPADTA
jgi:CubicO group peptidase (beta-lactamase class C family)